MPDDPNADSPALHRPAATPASAATAPRDAALAGLRVLDFSIMLAGPYCARLLADLGADVVKIEPPEGDDMRLRTPLREGHSAYFGQLNAGKRSLTLDLKNPAAIATIRRLVENTATRLRLLSAGPREEIIARSEVSLEDGKWKVTAGPKTIDTTPVEETAPPIEGAAILEHEIGKVALAYAKEVAAGKFDAAASWLSGPARAKRAAEPAAERKESDAYRKSTTPAPAAFADQIRVGGRLSFVGDKAYLQTVVSETTKNADGSITASSSSMSLGFELDGGKWRLSN